MTTLIEIQEVPPEEPRILCSLSAATVLRVLGFAAKNDIRYYLNGFNVRAAANPVVCASDGHVAYSEEDADGMAEIDLLLSITTRSTSILKRGHKVIVEGTSLRASLTVVDSNQTVIYVEPGNAIVQGRFPDIRAALGDFEKWEEGLAGAFQVPLLKRILTMQGAVRFYHEEGSVTGRSAAYFTFRGFGGEKGCGAVMPYSALESVKSSIPALYIAA